MADTLRVRSGLPMRIAATEPTPDEFKDKPGLAPALRSVEIVPGLNELSAADAEVYRAWAKASPNFIADADAVKAGNTTGLVYEVTGDEPDDEYGFEPALARAQGSSEGSTVTDVGPVKASDMAQKSDPSTPAILAPGTVTPASVVAKPAAPAAAPAK